MERWSAVFVKALSKEPLFTSFPSARMWCDALAARRKEAEIRMTKYCMIVLDWVLYSHKIKPIPPPRGKRLALFVLLARKGVVT